MPKDPDAELEALNESLAELKPYSGYILELLARAKREKTFHMYKYRNFSSEAYYNEVVALNKIINILTFILK